MKWMKHAPVIAAAFFLATLSLWMLLYPSEDNPKNLGYKLWKAGVIKMNLDTATGTMVGDVGRDQLVIGKTRADLQCKFGFLLKPNQAPEYDRYCYQNSPWYGKNVLFIRTSNWMIVFEGDKAVDLVLAKGC
jgi:hypothetical protein